MILNTKRMISIPKRLFANVLFVTLALTIAASGQDVLSSRQCKEKNQSVKRTLDKNNDLFMAIDRNETGHGRVFSWTWQMKQIGIKHAAASVRFQFNGSDIRMALDNVRFYTSYYYFAPEASVSTSRDTRILELQKVLRLPFFAEALDVLSGINAPQDSCGTVYVNILDDGCLPVPSEIPFVEKSCNLK